MDSSTQQMIIKAEGLAVTIGRRQLLRDVSFTVGAGTLTALIGRNGAGKSTLLRTLANLSDNYTGTIAICDDDLRSVSPGGLARMVSFVTTERIRIPGMTCRRVVALGRAPYTDWIGNLSDKDEAAVDDALDAVGVSHYANRYIDTLSDGERQRVMIARALAQDTPVIYLDEPTSFLDIPGRISLCRLLASLAHDHGKTIIFSTHELDLATRFADALLLIDCETAIKLLPQDTRTQTILTEAFGPDIVNLDGFRNVRL